jgi:hypothetical protein
MVWIPGGKKFIGPVELVRYHSEFIAGFLTRPSVPCNRGPGEIPMVFKGVPMYEMEQKILEALKGRKIKVSGHFFRGILAGHVILKWSKPKLLLLCSLYDENFCVLLRLLAM